MKYLLTIVFLALILGSCRKDDLIEVSGLLTDPNRQVPVEGVQVEVWTQKLESGMYLANYFLEETQETLADGTFKFRLANRNYTSVKLVFSKDGFFGWETTVNSETLKKEQSSYAVYQILPKAWIRFRIVNSEPVDGSDFFEFRLMNGYVSCEDCCRSDLYKFTGVTVNQETLCQLAGHQEVLIHWSSRKGGEQVFQTDKHFISAFDTTLISFLY